jgi:hypothetical protein
MEYVQFPFSYVMFLSSERIHGTKTRIHHNFRGKVLGKIPKLHIKYVLKICIMNYACLYFKLKCTVAEHCLKLTVTSTEVLQQSKYFI